MSGYIELSSGHVFAKDSVTYIGPLSKADEYYFVLKGLGIYVTITGKKDFLDVCYDTNEDKEEVSSLRAEALSKLFCGEL